VFIIKKYGVFVTHLPGPYQHLVMQVEFLSSNSVASKSLARALHEVGP
jgi:hypothetical protein